MKPFEDTYEVFTNDAKYKAKDYSLIPEFRISEHMDYYVNEQAGNFLADNDNLFTIHGATYASSSDDNFAKIYLNSDFLKDFGKIREEHKDLATPTKIELKAHAIMKFVPYEGFYPVERTLDLVTLFSQSYGPNMILTGTQPSPRPINQALFAPGILYNSIKSGIGVSHPIIPERESWIDAPYPYNDYGDLSINAVSPTYAFEPDVGNAVLATRLLSVNFIAINQFFGQIQWGKKIPFESILEPEKFLSSPILDLIPHPSATLDATSSLGEGSPLYKIAINNFLANSVEFFNKNSVMTSIVSAHDKDSSFFNMEMKKKYKMRLYLRACEEWDEYNIMKAAGEGLSTTNKQGITDTDYLFTPMLAMSLTASTEFTRPTFSMYDRPYFSHDDLPEETTTFKRSPETYKAGPTAFGPPLYGSQCSILVNGLTDIQVGTYGSVGCEMYTPPYYEGFSFVEFEFKPYDNNGNRDYSGLDSRRFKYTLEDIMNNITASYYRYSTTPIIDYYSSYFVDSNIMEKNISMPLANRDFSTLQEYMALTGTNISIVPSRRQSSAKYYHMQINDSINLKTIIKNKKVIYDDNGAVLSIEDDPTAGSRWVIQPKWESPIFDYTNACTAPLPNSGSQNIGRGVWHNYGEDLTGGNGLFLTISDVPSQFLSGTEQPLYGGLVNDAIHLKPTRIQTTTLTASLAEVLGFPKIPYRIGDIATKQKVYEAIVAIPFLDIHGRRGFFKLDEGLVTLAKTGNVNGRDISAGNSVKKTVEAMKKYVIPPKFDFVTYDGKNGKPKVDPIVMYFLEFDYEFDREDIKRIWHNMAPKEKIQEATATISHELLENELMDSHSDKLKWMVFKVKQKGAWNYYEKTLDSSDDQRFKFKFNVNDQAATPDYSYNWPYDFMSVIQFAKLESKVWIETNEEAEKRRAKIKPQKAIKPRIDVATSARDLINRTSNFKPAETVPFTIQSNIEQSLINNIARITDPNRRETQKENIIANIGTRTKIDPNNVGKIVIPSKTTQQSSIDEDKVESPIGTNTTLFGTRKL